MRQSGQPRPEMSQFGNAPAMAGNHRLPIRITRSCRMPALHMRNRLRAMARGRLDRPGREAPAVGRPSPR